MKNNITPENIRKWNINELIKLAQALRERIIEVVTERGGHLAPSLGVVELTIALHYVFDTPKDKIIWDVGHQCYAHKLITGRWNNFDTLRTYQGIAGFPKRSESEYDTFDTGHSGNSISVALGITTAANLKGENIKSIAVIGDGSIVTGMAFEALNYAGDCHQNLIVVLNDNEMSIGKSTGAMAKYFSRMITGRMYNRLKTDAWNLLGMLPKKLSNRTRLAARKIEEGLKNLIAPSIIFEELGFRYLGPFDGHNIELLIDTFQRVKSLKGPVLIHVVTKKGKGYTPAEKDPEVFHGIGPSAVRGPRSADSGCDVFGKALVTLAEKDNRICAISAGMCLGTGLIEFKKKFPERFFDVGICEQHAVTFAAGLALKGLKPVVAIYATFLARAYDQIIQDVALQNLPVVFAVDRAGIVGEDGPTHHGNFDISYLRVVPNLTIAVPKDTKELINMLELGINQDGPFVIRYPRGSLTADRGSDDKIEIGKGEIVFKTADPRLSPRTGRRMIILAIGSMVANSVQAIQSILSDEEMKSCHRDTTHLPKKIRNSKFEIRNYTINPVKDKINIVLVNMRFVKPLDKTLLLDLIKPNDIIITVEENTLSGGFGSAIREIMPYDSKVMSIGLEDAFIELGTREQLLDQYGLSVDKLKDKFISIIKNIGDDK